MKSLLSICLVLVCEICFSQKITIKGNPVDTTIVATVHRVDSIANVKANAHSPSFTGTVSGVTKSMVGLGNVDNTADASKTFSASQISSGKLDTARIPVTVAQSADYVITTDGTNVTGQASRGSGYPTFSSTDLKVVVDSIKGRIIPVGGGIGSAGGKIYLSTGEYNSSDSISLTGWEGADYSVDGPNSQLIIEGAGWGTHITISSAHPLFYINNAIGLVLKNIRMTQNGTGSVIVADSTGTDQEASMYRSTFDNLWAFNSSSTNPAMYLRNYILCHFGYIWAQNVAGNGVILENASATEGLAYGNSTWDYLHTGANTSKTAPYAGLTITTAKGSTVLMNLNSFTHFENSGGYYGIHVKNAADNKFEFCDIEGIPVPVFLDSGAAYNVFNGGYLYPQTGDTAIKITSGTAYTTAGNSFSNIHFQTPNGTTAIYDASNYARPNSFTNLVFNGNAPTVTIANSSNTALSYRIAQNGGSTYNAIPGLHIPEGTNGRMGQTTLSSGTKAISISDLTTSSRAFVQLVSPSSASSTVQYKAVCTSGTLTITALIAAGTINTSDVSTLNYFIVN